MTNVLRLAGESFRFRSKRSLSLKFLQDSVLRVVAHTRDS